MNGWLWLLAVWAVAVVLIALFMSMASRADGAAPDRIPAPASKRTTRFFEAYEVRLPPEVEAEIAEMFDGDPDVRRRRSTRKRAERPPYAMQVTGWFR